MKRFAFRLCWSYCKAWACGPKCINSRTFCILNTLRYCTRGMNRILSMAFVLIHWNLQEDFLHTSKLWNCHIMSDFRRLITGSCKKGRECNMLKAKFTSYKVAVLNTTCLARSAPSLGIFGWITGSYCERMCPPADVNFGFLGPSPV